MTEDEPTCSACGRREEKCVCDNPMTNPPERTEAPLLAGRARRGWYPGCDWPMPPKEKP